MYFQIENGEIKGFSPSKDNLRGEVIEAKLPEAFGQEEHTLKNLKWDGKRVVLDPGWTPPPEPVPVEEKVSQLEIQVKVLAKKALNKTLDSHEQKILTDLMEALK